VRIEVEVRLGDREPLLMVHEDGQEWTNLHAINLGLMVHRATCPHSERRQDGKSGYQWCVGCGTILIRPPEMEAGG